MGGFSSRREMGHYVGNAPRPPGAFLFSPQRNDDFLVAPPKDNAAVLNRFQRNLVGLATDLQAKLLPFLHDLAVDDGEAIGLSESDGADHKG